MPPNLVHRRSNVVLLFLGGEAQSFVNEKLLLSIGVTNSAPPLALPLCLGLGIGVTNSAPLRLSMIR
jgi:hypothetical protein